MNRESCCRKQERIFQQMELHVQRPRGQDTVQCIVGTEVRGEEHHRTSSVRPQLGEECVTVMDGSGRVLFARPGRLDFIL